MVSDVVSAGAVSSEAVVSGIVSKLESAIDETGFKTFVLAGGVAANSHLREGISKLAEKKGVTLCIPPISLCGDNGAMIGAQGYYEYKNGALADTSLNAFASEEGARHAAIKGTDGIIR